MAGKCRFRDLDHGAGVLCCLAFDLSRYACCLQYVEPSRAAARQRTLSLYVFSRVVVQRLAPHEHTSRSSYNDHSWCVGPCISFLAAYAAFPT